MPTFKEGDTAYVVNDQGLISSIVIQKCFDQATEGRNDIRDTNSILYSPEKVFLRVEALNLSRKILSERIKEIDKELLSTPGSF